MSNKKSIEIKKAPGRRSERRLCHSVGAILVAVILAAFASSTVFAKDIADGEWIEVSTANFQFRSAMSEKETIKLARSLEVSRAAFSLITGVRLREPQLPMYIYVFRNHRDFIDVGGDPEHQNFFLPSMRNNVIVIHRVSTYPSWSETSILLHEYTHFLLRNHSIRRFPRWFDEGFAFYLSFVALRGGTFDVGLPNDHVTRSLTYRRWLPARDILVSGRSEGWSERYGYIFDIQSWLLVHYLTTDPERNEKLLATMATYQDHRAAGLGEIESFERAFGLSAGKLNRELKQYYDRGRYKFFSLNANELVPDFNPVVRPLSRAQINVDLGQIFLRLERPDRAYASFMSLTPHRIILKVLSHMPPKIPIST